MNKIPLEIGFCISEFLNFTDSLSFKLTCKFFSQLLNEKYSKSNEFKKYSELKSYFIKYDKLNIENRNIIHFIHPDCVILQYFFHYCVDFKYYFQKGTYLLILKQYSNLFDIKCNITNIMTNSYKDFIYKKISRFVMIKIHILNDGVFKIEFKNYNIFKTNVLIYGIYLIPIKSVNYMFKLVDNVSLPNEFTNIYIS